jgi:predicted O-linked N-acetylglucosamine transferase (SPINDLY family)
MPREQFLALFISIDIALDPFPYSGEATTLDGLWMGVPLITLAGDSCVSRRGVSHLSALGLQDLIAGSEDDYVTRAIGMASDLPRLSRLRQTLRDRLGASLLGDGAAYTRHFEAALRTAWQGMV